MTKYLDTSTLIQATTGQFISYHWIFRYHHAHICNYLVVYFKCYLELCYTMTVLVVHCYMAPNTCEPFGHVSISMMTPPNTRFSLISRSKTNLNTSKSRCTKVAVIGKDQHPVSIMDMISVEKHIWKKQSYFNNLVQTAYGMVDAKLLKDRKFVCALFGFLWL